MTAPFLPEGYETPASTSGRYMKLQDGDNRFRVLDSAIVGSELWIGKKPVRRPKADMFTREERETADPGRDGQASLPRHFWAFPVVDVADGQIKILEITQKTIQEGIMALVQDEDYGDPKAYDVVIKRAGEGKETAYTVLPKPAKPLDKATEAAWKETKSKGFDLKALFSGGDPFTAAASPFEEEPAPLPPDEEISIEDIEID